MDNARSNRAWTLLGAAALALTVGIMASRTAKAPVIADEEMRDAVASPVAPVSPALLVGARAAQTNAGYFASPAVRRAEAEAQFLPRPRSSRAALARAARLRREAARERALAVSAQ